VSHVLTFFQLRVLMNLHSVATRVRIDASPTLDVFFFADASSTSVFFGYKKGPSSPPLFLLHVDFTS
jgi:hypothetical protein